MGLLGVGLPGLGGVSMMYLGCIKGKKKGPVGTVGVGYFLDSQNSGCATTYHNSTADRTLFYWSQRALGTRSK